MYTVRVALESDALNEILAQVEADVADLFPHTLQTIRTLAEAAREHWQALALKQVPPPWRVAYREAIKIEMQVGDNTLTYSIYVDHPKAGALERGLPAWDMKKVLQTSKKVRVSRRGHKYLIIPFDWGEPSAIAVRAQKARNVQEQVATAWIQREPLESLVSVTKTGRRLYSWGDRLTPAEVRELGLDPEKRDEGRNLVGMVLMKSLPDRRQYAMTFRTMSEISDPASWIHPGFPALNLTEQVVRWLESIYPASIREALALDEMLALERFKE